MGTRAIITQKGKPLFATHWDGYPDELGKGLAKAKSMSGIFREAVKRYINSADRKFLKKSNLAMNRKLKGQAGYGWISKKKPFVYDIKGYDDWAEYQYDLDSKGRLKKWRALSGTWKSPTRKTGKWKIVKGRK